MREGGTGKIDPASDPFSDVAVFELANIFQWLTIMQDDLVLLTRDEYCHNLGFRSASSHVNCCGTAVNCFKQTLHLPVAVAQSRNTNRVSGVRNVDIRTNLNPWVGLARLDQESSR